MKYFNLFPALLALWLGVSAPAGATIFLVNNTFDDGSTNTVPNSIRWAVANANTITAGAPHTINFNLPSPVTVHSALTLSRPSTLVDGNSNTILSNGTNIFILSANSITIQNLALVGANAATGAIIIFGNTNMVYGCRIGTNWNNDTGLGNSSGIYITGSSNQIGGANVSNANVISGNNSYGVWINSGTDNRIQGNYIGTNSSGSVALPNDYGVYVTNASANRIGCLNSSDEGNLISGNTSYGVCIEDTSSDAGGNTICGNLIGLRRVTGILKNGCGVYIRNSPGNYIGLATGGYYNQIAGNYNYNILIDGTANRSRQNVIQNNYIGIDVGSSVFALTSPGIWLNNVDECQIGGNWANGETNVISGNWPNDGITLQYSSGNYITGNYIGTNTGGTAAAGNNCGIRLWRSQGNTIGGPKSGPFIVLANVVAGNSGGQIVLSEAPGNSVVGNYIGLNALGSSTIAGGGDSVVLNNSSGCLIGGQTKNIICGPAGASGVSITSDSHGNTLAGNWIGVLANGAAPSATLAAGISLSNNANNNRVGLQSGGQGNLIANAIAGIIVDGAGTTKNGLYGNTVCATTNPIILSNNGNIAKSAPIINGAVAGVVSGVAQAGDYVEVFKAEPLSGKNGGSLVWLGWGTAGAGGAWTVNVSGIAAGDYVCATATDSSRNTSGFSLNFLVPQPPSPTFTPTPTNSPTTTPTPTFTPTLSPFLTPTTSPTPGGIATVLPTATPDLGANFILYPNPAGDEMFLRMNLEEAGDVRASFYNINGDGVSVVSDSLPSGPGHILRWNCGHAAPGVYLVLVTKGSTVLFHAKAVVVR